MSPELERQFYERYPRMFLKRGPARMPWLDGFGCGDGWFNLIDALCHRLQLRIDKSRKQRANQIRANRALARKNRGDNGGIEYLAGRRRDGLRVYTPHWISTMSAVTPPDALPQIIVPQVKEKFGGLRFYAQYSDEVAMELIELAGALSRRTCDGCGCPSEVVDRDDWYTTRCSKCHALLEQP